MQVLHVGQHVLEASLGIGAPLLQGGRHLLLTLLLQKARFLQRRHSGNLLRVLLILPVHVGQLGIAPLRFPHQLLPVLLITVVVPMHHVQLMPQVG